MRKIIFINSIGFYVRAHGHDPFASKGALAVVRRGRILEASAEARRWGVSDGITVTLGQRRCPGLMTVDFDAEECHALYEQVWSLFAEVTPQVEPTDLHCGYLDLTGCERGRMKANEMMRNLNSRLRALSGIQLNWGGGSDRWTAKLACGEERLIAPEEEKDFLKRVPIRRLLPEHLCDRLLRYGVRMVADLHALPQHFIETHLQISSQEIRRYLIRDTSAIKCQFPPPRIEARMEVDWLRPEDLSQSLSALCADLEQQLKVNNLEAGLLRADFAWHGRKDSFELRATRALRSARQIEHFLAGFIREKQLRRLQKIHATLEQLTPRTTTQAELWHDPETKKERREHLLAAQETAKRKFGATIMQSGYDMMNRRRPRFAQMIYELRGIYLP